MIIFFLSGSVHVRINGERMEKAISLNHICSEVELNQIQERSLEGKGH